jgi:hypothetical protein
MFNRKMTASLMGGVVAVGLVLGGQAFAAFTAQDATKLEAEAQAALTKFQADTKGSEEVLANAKVYPGIARRPRGLHYRRESWTC